MGVSAAWLCTVVASIQDDVRNWRAVDISNAVLMKEMGISDKKALYAARDKAVQHGWLIYTSRKDRRSAGVYEIQIPDEVKHGADAVETDNSETGELVLNQAYSRNKIS